MDSASFASELGNLGPLSALTLTIGAVGRVTAAQEKKYILFYSIQLSVFAYFY